MVEGSDYINASYIDVSRLPIFRCLGATLVFISLTLYVFMYHKKL